MTASPPVLDIVVTMGCGDACPVVPGRRYLDWPVADPDGAPIAVVRDIRDAINAHVTDLLASLPAA
jgi:protein-tyrosine-phosphatase